MCSAKDTVKRIKTPTTHWEKIIARGMLCKALLLKIFMEQLNSAMGLEKDTLKSICNH
jgi:hypothetical protein